jgi:hexokinase
VDLHELSKTTWSRDKKELSFEEFIRLMAEQIARGANTAYIPLLTIALGFPQQPIGRDAVLRPNAMSKGWSMHDLENNRHRPIGAEVRASLQRMGIQVDNYTVLHDATSLAQSAVAHSSTISGGLAAGTGTGGSVVINGEIIDLQPSKLLIESTPILEEMQRRKLISQPMLGQLGGVYTGYTTGIALTKIGEQTPGAQGPLLQALGERLLKEDDAPTVISGVLEGKVTSDDLSQGFGLPISDNELRVLNQIAVPVFSAAGQLYGMVGAAIARYEQPFDTSNLLFGGSMLGKGVGIKDRAEKTAQQLGYPIRFTESSSLTGSAIYGMSQHYASNRLSHRN